MERVAHRPSRSGGGFVILALLSGLGSGRCSSAEVVDGFPDEYVGVGLELTTQEDAVVVVRPLPGGPGAMAGMEPGDKIVSVNGSSMLGKSLGDVVMKLRGPENSQVTVGVERAGQAIFIVVRRTRMIKGRKDYKADE